MNKLINGASQRIITSSGITIAQSPTNAFVDNFRRTDGPLGNGWINGWDWDATAYDPVGIYNQSVVVSDATARVGATYAADQFSAHPPANGEQNVGLGCAWRETGSSAVYVEAEWTGLWKIKADGSGSGHHVEGAPCVHFVPGSPEHAFGLWPSAYTVNGPPIFWLSGIGNPPEEFPSYIYGFGSFTPVNVVDGQPRRVGIYTTGTHMTFWLDGGPGIGTQISVTPTSLGASFGWTTGLSPQPVPTNLVNSTLHGFELDTHFVSPPEAEWTDIPHTPVINQITIRPV